MHFMKSILAVAFILTGATGAQAVTAAPATCGPENGGGNKYVQLSSLSSTGSSNVTCVSTVTKSASAVDYSGSPVQTTFLGETFTLAFKSDDNQGDKKVTFAEFSNGSWALGSIPDEVGKIVIGIKQGTTYAGFLVSSTTGTWATGKTLGNLGTNYSHVDIWYTVAPVPVPAALPLLALGVGAFGLAARRKRRATTL